jgi:phage terminase large subunit-like protein
MTALPAAVAMLSKLSPQSRALLLTRIEANLAHRQAHQRFACFYPDTGPLRRELYPKHMAFFAAGREHQERAFIAGNRTGKSSAASYELTAHLSGVYPKFWIGRRFNRPITAWAAGEDAKTVRETIQVSLLGDLSAPGTGMLPSELIVSKVRRAGVPEAIDSAVIKHVSGGTSRVVLKSYDQGREAFQGAKIDVGWCDEEPPLPVYTEMLTRTMSTTPGDRNGIVMCTFTPLRGLSGCVRLFLPTGKPAA